MNLGEKLFELRKKKGLSQEEVAYELNVTRQTISKWETNQTTPDFDKIAPLCNLYEISTDELLSGKKSEIKKDNKVSKRSNAIILSLSIFLYFFAVALLIFMEDTLKMQDGIVVAVFLIICAIATCLLIYNYAGKEKQETSKEKKIKNKLQKQIEEVITTITLIIYLIVSFLTAAWHITWILWIINAVICEIVKLIFMLKGEEVNEE